MYTLYRLITFLLYPFIYIKYRITYKNSDFFKHNFALFQKNQFKFTKDCKIAWINAVSVGEVTTALNFAQYIEKENYEILFTVRTKEAYKLLISKGVKCVYAPLDFICVIRSFLSIVNPDIIIFIEADIFPNVVYEINKKNIPLYLINAKISINSFKRWKLVRGFFRKLLMRFKLVIAQSTIDSQRFKYFYSNNVLFLGNFKFAVNHDSDNIKKDNLKIIITAASTHKGEEEIVLSVFKKLNEIFKNNILLVLAPRHPYRVGALKPLLTEFKYQLRSKFKTISPETEIYILDTVGELNDFYKKSHIAFVGGSFVKNVGGHNIFEPAIAKNVVIHGPFMQNQFEMKLEFKDTIKEVATETELYTALKSFICDKNLISQFAEASYKIACEMNRKMINETIHLIKKTS